MRDIDKRAILRKRAEAIGRAKTIKADAQKSIEILDFVLNGEVYALETPYIKKVCTIEEVVNVPGVPEFVIGIFCNLGEVISVLDLQVLFKLSKVERTSPYRLIVLSKDDMDLAVCVDAIGTVREIRETELYSVSPLINNLPEGYLKAVAPVNVIILDADYILRDRSLLVSHE